MLRLNILQPYMCLCLTMMLTTVFCAPSSEQKRTKGRPYVTEAPLANTTSDKSVGGVSSFIIRGNDADPHEYPFMVSVRIFNNFVCGGTFHTGLTVITAKHCVAEALASSLSVVVGEHNRFQLEGTEQVITVSEVKLHPDANIALLKLSQVPRFNAAVDVLGEHNLVVTVPSIGKTATTVGWGSTGGINYSAVLRHLNFTLVGTSICDIVGLNPSAHDICAGHLFGSDYANVCYADEGGPLVMREAEGSPWKLLGVIQKANPECVGGEHDFAIFISIPAVRQWILDNDYAACFPGSARVQTPLGHKRMFDVKVGDLVLTVHPDGTSEYTPIISFLHREPAKPAYFLTLSTAKYGKITLSLKHLIFRATEESGKFRTSVAVFASSIQAGDTVFVSTTKGLESARVTSITDSMDTGVYAPLTSSGIIVVDHVVTSCYATFEYHEVAHLTFAPLRWYLAIKIWWEGTSVEQHLYCKKNQCKVASKMYLNGVHWYPKLLMSIFPSLY